MTEKIFKSSSIYYASIHVSLDICDIFLNDMKTDFVSDNIKIKCEHITLDLKNKENITRKRCAIIQKLKIRFARSILPLEAPCIVSFEHCDYFRYIFLRGLLVALLLSRSSL